MNIHCATHRMNLTDAGDVAGSQPIQNLTQLLNKSYWFWVKRPRDVMKMRRLASYFGQKRPLTLKQHADTRWLYEYRRLHAFLQSRRMRLKMYQDMVLKGKRGKEKKASH